MSKVLFIVHDVHQSDNHFPSGVGYLAAVLEREGHHVDVISQDVWHHSNDYVAGHIRSTNPDIIAIGFLAARFRETVLPLCEVVNSVKGDGWLVLGGHGASGCPEYVQNETNADHVIVGEGEDEMARMAHGIEDIYPQWGDGETIQDLDSLPFPAWDLFPVNEYKKQLRLPGWEIGDYTLGVVSSRGCVGKCTFCQRLSKGIRFRSMESVVEEIEILYGKYGINYIYFQDEMFISTKKRMYEFFDELKRRNLLGLIKWGGSSRVDAIDEEMLEIIKATNCQYLSYGFESMDTNVLRKMNKKTTPGDNQVCAELTKKAGIPMNVNMLWGMPGDSLLSLKRNLQFIKEYDSYSFLRTIRPPTPYPGCELFDMAVDQGLLSGPADFFDRFTNSDRMTVNFTDIPDEEFYMNLYQANGELIRRYYEHQRHSLTGKFYDVYFKQDATFRGARHYG